MSYFYPFRDATHRMISS